MRIVNFITTLFFIIGSSSFSFAIQPIASQKIIERSVAFPENKTPNLIQRILLKKMERKLARQIRKANKKQANKPTDKKTRRGILVGLGSAVSSQIAISGAISITKFAARLRFLGLFGGIAIILAVIAIVLGVRSLKRREQAVISEKRGKWKIWFGIFLGILGILGTLSAIGIAV